MTDIQAAIGVVQLSRTEQLLEGRRRAAEIYNAHLADHPMLEPPHVPEGLDPNWQSYQVMLRDDSSLTRNEIMTRLHASGIPTRRGVMASHLEPPYRGRGDALPNTEHVAANSLMLPMHSGLSEDQARRVLTAVDALVG
jgi:perosamine synthetase